MRILTLAPHIPKRDHASGDRRFCYILERLALEHRLYLWPSIRPNRTEARYVRQLKTHGIEILRGGSNLREAIARHRYDWLWCEFWHSAAWQAEVVRRWQPWCRVMVDTVDVHFERERAEMEGNSSLESGWRSRKMRELSSYKEADGVITVTDEDGQCLDREDVKTPRFLIPNVVPVVSRAERQREATVLFIGGFNHQPNVDGITWFCQECWPFIRRAVADARLQIIGSNASDAIRALGREPGVEVLGFVPETRPYLESAAVSIAPLRYGAGMKGKVTEALAHGIPLVTTPVGAQGFGLVSGKQAVVAEAPLAFAQGVVHLLRNQSEAHCMALCGQTIAGSLCSPEVVNMRISKMVGEMLRGKRPQRVLRWGTYSALVKAATLVNRVSNRRATVVPGQ